jgi:hypothetical protein
MPALPGFVAFLVAEILVKTSAKQSLPAFDGGSIAMKKNSKVAAPEMFMSLLHIGILGMVHYGCFRTIACLLITMRFSTNY